MRLQALASSRKTTLTGSLATFSAILISLIPDNVWSACSAAVQETGSPVFTAILLVSGISLTVIGPSLASGPQKPSSKDSPEAEET